MKERPESPAEALERVRRDMEVAVKNAVDQMYEISRRPYGAYGEALELIRIMEDRLCVKLRLPFKRYFWVPLSLMLRALKEMVISYGVPYTIFFIAAVVALLASPFLPQSIKPNAEAVTSTLNLLLIFTLVFAAPSTYCSAGTNAKHVSDLKTKLTELQVNSKERVDLILKNNHLFEDRVKRRLLIFRWLLGAAWAVWFSPILTDVARGWASGSFSIARLALLFPPFAYLVVFFLLVEMYARGVDILFRSIELGCNERLADIDRAAGRQNAA